MHFIARFQVSSEVHSWLHSIVHSLPGWLTLPSKLSRHSQVHSENAPKYTQYILMYTPGHALKDAPKCIRWHTPSLLDLHSQVSSQDAPKYTPSTPPSTPSTFSCTLPGMLSRTLLIALDGTLLACLALRSRVHSQEGGHSRSHDASQSWCWQLQS